MSKNFSKIPVIFVIPRKALQVYELEPGKKDLDKLISHAYGFQKIFVEALKICDAKADAYRVKVLRGEVPFKYMTGTHIWLYQRIAETMAEDPFARDCPSTYTTLAILKAIEESKIRANIMNRYDKDKKRDGGKLVSIPRCASHYAVKYAHVEKMFQLPISCLPDVQISKTRRLTHKVHKGKGAAVIRVMNDEKAINETRLYLPKFREGIRFKERGVEVPPNSRSYVILLNDKLYLIFVNEEQDLARYDTVFEGYDWRKVLERIKKSREKGLDKKRKKIEYIEIKRKKGVRLRPNKKKKSK